jgi:S-DNA-T family DNA segregation ATPase FtsK/SpoIIIE
LEDVPTKYRPSGNGPRSVGGGDEASGGGHEERDEKFNEAARMCSQYDQASSSLIQRRLKVGYARAARILDQLCEAGLVGQANGSKPREVNREAVNAYLSKPENI